jgi:signal transduction histidine kinase
VRPGGHGTDGGERDHRQLRHDIHHELATIALLASLLTTAEDVGPSSRRRAAQLLDESRWLHDLVVAADDSPQRPAAAGPPVRLDLVAADVVRAATLSTTVRLDAEETWSPVESLAFWRVLTNLVGNAVRAAGRFGEVRVTVREVAAQAVVRVEDDGPGFGVGPAGLASLGLGIVLDLVDAMAGAFDIGGQNPGGCWVEVRLPAARARRDEAA